eukprot:g41409.t1
MVSSPDPFFRTVLSQEVLSVLDSSLAVPSDEKLRLSRQDDKNFRIRQQVRLSMSRKNRRASTGCLKYSSKYFLNIVMVPATTTLSSRKETAILTRSGLHIGCSAHSVPLTTLAPWQSLRLDIRHCHFQGLDTITL